MKIYQVERERWVATDETKKITHGYDEVYYELVEADSIGIVDKCLIFFSNNRPFQAYNEDEWSSVRIYKEVTDEGESTLDNS